MPASNTPIEYASAFGALDSAQIAQGKSGDAHLLRTIATNANRFAGTGQTILSLAWSVQNNIGTGVYAAAGEYAASEWKSVFGGTILCPRTPHLRAGEVRFVAKVTNAATVYLQIATTAAPFNPRAVAGAPNVLTCLGTGDLDEYTLAGLPLGGLEIEPIAFFLRGEDGVYPATGVTPTSGTIDAAYRDFFIDNTGISPTGAWAPGRYRAKITHGTTGEMIGHERTVVHVNTGAVGFVCYVEPGFADVDLNGMTNHGAGASYAIGEAPGVQFAGLVIAEEDDY